MGDASIDSIARGTVGEVISVGLFAKEKESRVLVGVSIGSIVEIKVMKDSPAMSNVSMGVVEKVEILESKGKVLGSWDGVKS